MANVSIRERRWFTTGQVGRLIHASDETIVRYIKAGKINASRAPGGWYKIAREDVEAFLEEYEYDVGILDQ